MSAERAVFYTRPPERFVLDMAASNREAYTGAERRMETRRSSSDRRVDERFNLTKPDRRETQGRRAEDAIPFYW